MAQKHKKKHYTRQEILAMCNGVARESRMCNRTPYTAMPILVLYVMLTGENWKQKRLANLANAIQEYLNKIESEEISLDGLNKRLFDKADWSIEYENYELSDIKQKKGTFRYWLDERQLFPQNEINRHATTYLLSWFNSLMDMGYGKDRLTRVQTTFNDLLTIYQQDKTSVGEMSLALLKEGIAIEQPIDPLTQQRGSMMTV